MGEHQFTGAQGMRWVKIDEVLDTPHAVGIALWGHQGLENAKRTPVPP